MNIDPLLPINIAGEMRPGGGAEYASLYPATGEAVARLRAASAADVLCMEQKSLYWGLNEEPLAWAD